MTGEDLNDSVDDFMDIPSKGRRGVNNPPKVVFLIFPTTFASKHAINLSFFGGAANFSKWMDMNTRSKVENLIAGASLPIGACGRIVYNSSQEIGNTQENLFDGDSESGHGEDHDEAVEAGAEIDVDMDKPSEGDGGGQDGTKPCVNGQDIGINKAGERREAHVICGVGGSGGGIAALLKRGGEGVGDDGIDVTLKRARVDPVATRRSEAIVGSKATKSKVVSAPTRLCPRLLNDQPPESLPAREPIGTTTHTSHPAVSETRDPIILHDRRDVSKRRLYRHSC